MRFERALRRIARDLYDNDPGCAHEVIQRVGYKRFADGLSKSYNWKVKVIYCGPLYHGPFNEECDSYDAEGFIEEMLSRLISSDICPMCVLFYKSTPEEQYCDIFECLFDTTDNDYEEIYNMFEDYDNMTVVREIPWQDFCDVRRQMCAVSEYYFWNFERYAEGPVGSGSMFRDCYSYLLGPHPALPQHPAAAA